MSSFKLKLQRPLREKHQHLVYCIQSLVSSEIDHNKLPKHKMLRQEDMNSYRKTTRSPQHITFVKHPDNLIPVLLCFAKNRFMTYLPPPNPNQRTSSPSIDNIRIDLINKIRFPLQSNGPQVYIYREERGNHFYDMYIFSVPTAHTIANKATLFKYLSEHLTTSPVAQFAEEKSLEGSLPMTKTHDTTWNFS